MHCTLQNPYNKFTTHFEINLAREIKAYLTHCLPQPIIFFLKAKSKIEKLTHRLPQLVIPFVCVSKYKTKYPIHILCHYSRYVVSHGYYSIFGESEYHWICQ